MKSFLEAIDGEVVRVLENWAMMLVDPIKWSPNMFNPEEGLYTGVVDFQGIVNGGYALLCQAAFADSVASNLLGSDVEVQDRDRMDVLRELLNVLGGNLLTQMYGEDTAFKLIHPQVVLKVGEGAQSFFEDASRVRCYTGDEQPMAVGFWLTGLGGYDH